MLSDCLEYWQGQKREQGRKEQTIRNVSAIIETFIRKIGNKPINLMSPADFEKWESQSR